MNAQTLRAFEQIGAAAIAETRGGGFAIDVVEEAGREQFKLTYPWNGAVTAEVLDVKPRMRHLVLDVIAWGSSVDGRFLCGHDERHWFVAALPVEHGSRTVRGAMESLKPELVRREQRRRGVKHRRTRRKTAAYIRQGEWFFLPRPMMHVGEKATRNGVLVRGRGKPHRAEWLYRPDGGEVTFVRGAVSHPDHETIYLQVWHRVVQNNETQPAPQTRPLVRMDYLD